MVYKVTHITLDYGNLVYISVLAIYNVCVVHIHSVLTYVLGYLMQWIT